jgi:hypothetical protein
MRLLSAALLLVAVLAATVAIPAAGQSPSAPASPTPSFQPTPPMPAISDSAEDDRFRLTIRADRTTYSPDEPISVTTTLTHVGTEPLTVASSGGGVVYFTVEQLDGPIDAGGVRHGDCRYSEFGPGEVRDVPFAKTIAFEAGDPLAAFWLAWVDDPVLRLPAGTYRISATVDYGVGRCGGTRTLTAAVDIEVTDALASPDPSPEPSAASGALELYSPVDPADVPFRYACDELRFRAEDLTPVAGEGTDDEALAAQVRRMGGALLGWRVVAEDERRALIARVVDDGPRARDPLYTFSYRRDGDTWRWGGRGRLQAVGAVRLRPRRRGRPLVARSRPARANPRTPAPPCPGDVPGLPRGRGGARPAAGGDHRGGGRDGDSRGVPRQQRRMLTGPAGAGHDPPGPSARRPHPL